MRTAEPQIDELQNIEEMTAILAIFVVWCPIFCCSFPACPNKRNQELSPRRLSAVLCLAAALICRLASAGPAADSATGRADTNAVPAEAVSGNGRFDRYHAEVSDQVSRYIRRFDEYLAGRNIPAEPTGSWIRVIPRVEAEEGKGVKVGAAFKSRIVLPHLPDRLELIADNVPRGILPGKDVAPDQYDSVNAGLRWNLLRRDLSWVDVDGGVNLKPWPSPFTRLTVSHAFVWDNVWSLELSQQGFLYVNDDGFGEMSQVELTRALASGSYARAVAAATWSEETEGVEWEQTSMLWRNLGRQRTIETSFSFFGHVDSASLMDNYRLNATYRWNALRPWLFFSVTPQVSFPRERDYRLTPLLRFCVEITCSDA